MADCLFCRIRDGELPSNKVYENDRVLAFKDINPVAPVHILIIPKEHIDNVNGLDKSNVSVVADIHLAAVEIARQQGLSETGYRLITNCGKEAGQTVMHLHYHLLGGSDFGERLL
jgi:histidine triad (HIT) family protein